MEEENLIESEKNGMKRKNKRGTNPEFIAQMGKGKPKGCVSRFTDIKSAFLNAFERIGHEDALVEYAKTRRGRGHLFEIIARMLPREIRADVGGKLVIERRIIGDKPEEGK